MYHVLIAPVDRLGSDPRICGVRPHPLFGIVIASSASTQWPGNGAHFANHVYYVMNRAAKGTVLFANASDYLQFERTLESRCRALPDANSCVLSHDAYSFSFITMAARDGGWCPRSSSG